MTAKTVMMIKSYLKRKKTRQKNTVGYPTRMRKQVTRLITTLEGKTRDSRHIQLNTDTAMINVT